MLKAFSGWQGTFRQRKIDCCAGLRVSADDRDREIEREREIKEEKDRERERQWERERERKRERKRGRERDKETERDRERDRERLGEHIRKSASVLSVWSVTDMDYTLPHQLSRHSYIIDKENTRIRHTTIWNTKPNEMRVT